MQRKEAEKLLAALIFDDLDEASKTELLNYLQTDNELRERLADMRMAAKVASDTVKHEPDPVLGRRRLKHLAKLARHQSSWTTIFTAPRLAAAAAIFIIGIVGLAMLQPALQKASERGIPYATLTTKIEADYDERGSTSTWARSQVPTGPSSKSRRTPEITSTTGQYAYDPAVRGPAALDRTVLGLPVTVTNGAFQDDRRDFIVDNFEAYNAQTPYLNGYINHLPKPDSVEKWASGSSFEGKPHSGVPIGGGDGSYYVGGYRGGGYGGYGSGGYGGYGDRSGYSSRGGDSGSGFISGDMLGVTGSTYEGDINWRGKGTNLFTSPDATGIVADGIPTTGKYILHNGEAVDFGLSGPTDSRENVLHIDNFTTVDNDGDRSRVAVVGEPVTFTEPELTPAPPPAPPSQTMKDVSGISDLPDIKLRAEDAESHVLWVDAHKDMRSEEPWRWKGYDKKGGISKKIEDELGTFSYQIVPEKIKPVKPFVPDYVEVVEGGREGDISKETEEELSHERDEKSVSSSEKTATNFSKAIDKIIALPGVTRSTDYESYESSAPAEGPAGKEENGRIPILGDIPLVGHLYSGGDMKRPLTEEEKKRVVAYLEQKKSQPEGGPAELGYETIKLKYANPQEVEDSIEEDFRDLPGTGEPAKVLIKALPQDHQIIVFGRKEQREAVRNMIREIDVPPGESEVDRTSTLMGEDGTDLPPASRFKLVPVNPWVMAERDPLSTFALDVDTASYTLCRRYIRGGFLPPAGAVRMEEFINYFNYHYPQRTNPTFAVHAEAAPSPFARKEQSLTLLKIGVKARTIGRDQRKAAHLIFVVDASASMDQPDRLPLVQRALSLLVNKLSAVDRVSLITCANEARLHLETVPASERDRIRQAIHAIQPAGPTNLLAGLKLGYATARRTFAPKQINHVVLCSDGVANVGQTEAEAVLEEVAEDRKQGITITCVGVGYGSYNDAFLEALANQGDGSYMFLDSLRQVHRLFVRQLAATLQTVARDARIQVDFNPNRVRRYRLIGYENRDIEDERFRDDTIDAGEVGSGQCSTALYELELIGQPSADRQEDLGTVFVRYRDVETGQFEEISSRLSSAIVRRLTVESAPRFFLAASAARFAEILRQSEHAQDGNLMDVFRVVEQVSLALPLDSDVRELAELIRKSENLPGSP